MKNPTAATANATMPTSSIREFRGGKLRCDICSGIQSGCVIWMATTYSHTSSPKTNRVKATGRSSIRLRAKTHLLYVAEVQNRQLHSLCPRLRVNTKRSISPPILSEYHLNCGGSTISSEINCLPWVQRKGFPYCRCEPSSSINRNRHSCTYCLEDHEAWCV